MNTTITTYAPVIIPTLNRNVHFERCLESLERCRGADQTEVYVALDYPPSEKYKEGWKKIDDYLRLKESQNGFKKLHVIRRDRNYGICHENGNYETLIREIKKSYDRYILSEDDNEFSPCFLEFQNKCLERFKDDPRINLVCGYNYVMDFPEMYKNNFYLTKWGCPWGTGEWTSKQHLLERFCSLEGLSSILKDKEMYALLKRRDPDSIEKIVTMLKIGRIWGDAVKGICKIIYDTYCVMPRESMVRNYGNDGTGDHSKRLNSDQNNHYLMQPISEETHFEFTDDVFTYEPIYLERHHYTTTFMPYTWLRRIYKKFVFKTDLFLFRHFNYIPKSKYL